MIWSAECRRTLRSSRVVALLGLYSLFTVGVFLLVALFRSLAQQLTQSGMLSTTEEMPVSVLGVFYLSLFFLPLYVALMGFDQISGEVGPRSIRYLTVRARRTSVLLGKFLAQATILLVLVYLLDLALCVYAWVTTPGFGAATFALNVLRFWLASTVFSVAFLALTSLCSSLTPTSSVSLISNFGVLLLSFVLWLTAFCDPANPARYLRFLSPLRYSLRLIYPDAAQVAGGVAAYVVFTALFLGSALYVLRTRDL
ncbi:ABC transporter permease [Vitiosangium sp. GDMCC 1.1324]|uniref:ABC transporter permease n=1 Tax=Vitiosangium sp. (strain GDMCC 1.1324) TaxID=2138576 RepID=UPI000D3A6E53|nr:ABC transporter permease subunit [Vitiosangium sp. GDMCC 1.1324]PTL75897.1 ABC transporter permease [Vitiosangium sp. GDMCC 1.1324]